VFLAFLTVVLLVVVGVHSYLWWRLVKSTTRPGRWRRAGTITIVALALLLPATLIGGRLAPTQIATPLEWTGFIWMAVMFYLLVFLLCLEIPRAALWTGRKISARRRGSLVPAASRTAPGAGGEANSGPATDGGEGPDGDADGGRGLGGAPEADGGPEDSSRRLFLARSFAATSVVAATGTVAYGADVAAGPADVRRVPITLAKLDPALDGFTIGLISDVHLSPLIRRPFLDDVVQRLNAARPGLVAIVGDLVDGDVAELGREAGPLKDLRTRHGVYFVTGNHEYISGAEQWVEFLPSLGVRVLRNERVRITQSGAAFDLAGIDDRTAADSGVPGHGANVVAALADRDPDVPVVLLAHQPVQFGEAAR
jgi:hypothetical protein